MLPYHFPKKRKGAKVDTLFLDNTSLTAIIRSINLSAQPETYLISKIHPGYQF